MTDTELLEEVLRLRSRNKRLHQENLRMRVIIKKLVPLGIWMGNPEVRERLIREWVEDAKKWADNRATGQTQLIAEEEL